MIANMLDVKTTNGFYKTNESYLVSQIQIEVNHEKQ